MKDVPERTSIASLVRPGYIVELSSNQAQGLNSVAVSCILHMQRIGETTVWVQSTQGSLYPPDLARAGVDLDALPTVHVPPLKLSRAAEIVLRSGAFGLVVLDLREHQPAGIAWQSRLAQMARKNASRLILLTSTDRQQPSAGPMVSLRFKPHWRRTGTAEVELVCEVLKNKVGAHVEQVTEQRTVPDGLALMPEPTACHVNAVLQN
ncbi:MAG: hypothetical protein AAF355_10440 [Myxococcota bacterium]